MRTRDFSSKFRAANGVWLTKSLFHEFRLQGTTKENVLYTLGDADHPSGIPSLRRLYLATNDLTEYAAANKYFDGWSHWCKIKDQPWFLPYITKWREELEVKLKSEVLTDIILESRGESKSAPVARRWLMEKGFHAGSPTKEKAGRPSKEKIDAEALELALRKSETDEDERRILN